MPSCAHGCREANSWIARLSASEGVGAQLLRFADRIVALPALIASAPDQVVPPGFVIEHALRDPCPGGY